MGKRKVIAWVISIVVIVVVITGMIVTQLFMKMNVMNQISKSVEQDVPQALVNASSWDTSKVTVYTDKSGRQAPIPKGYVASKVTGETEINTGLVIYEGEDDVTGTEVGVPGTAAWTASCSRNQWVWVPVSNTSRIYNDSTKMAKLYERTSTGRGTYTNDNYEPGFIIGTDYDNEAFFSQYNLVGMTKQKLYDEIQVELYETIQSIKKYGGFYIGRYETGDVTNLEDTRFVRPVVQRMRGEESIDYVTWYDAYKNLRTLGASSAVKANIIPGCLWDETLQWFQESGAKTAAEIYDSSDWGNHAYTTFEYYTDVEGNADIKSGSGIVVPTGSSEQNKANNIYDMAGNLLEWTLETYGDARSFRGGHCGATIYESTVDTRDWGYVNESWVHIRCTCVPLHKIEILRSKSLFYKYFEKAYRL